MTLPTLGVFMMRILSKKQVRERVLYSPSHIDRLEKEKKFPQRVKIGPNRVGWIEDEIDAWIAVFIAKRDNPTPGPPFEISRFRSEDPGTRTGNP
jgi:prophage regulatory protein